MAENKFGSLEGVGVGGKVLSCWCEEGHLSLHYLPVDPCLDAPSRSGQIYQRACLPPVLYVAPAGWAAARGGSGTGLGFASRVMQPGVGNDCLSSSGLVAEPRSRSHPVTVTSQVLNPPEPGGGGWRCPCHHGSWACTDPPSSGLSVRTAPHPRESSGLLPDAEFTAGDRDVFSKEAWEPVKAAGRVGSMFTERGKA